MTAGVSSVRNMAEVLVFFGFERNWWKGADGRTKSEVIVSALEMTPAEYDERLLSIAQYPEAVSYDPMLAKKIVRMAAAKAQRS